MKLKLLSGRRSFLQALPFMAVPAAAATLPVKPKGDPAISEDLETSIICAALEKIGALAPGRGCSAGERQFGKFHLDGMRQEGVLALGLSQSEIAIRLAYRITPIPFAFLTAQWMGDDAGTIAPPQAIIAGGLGTATGTIKEELAFFAGDQWDPTVKRERMAQNRPVLVVNRLPGLVAASMEKRRLALGPTQKTALILAIVRRNRDAQLLHNYLCCAIAERAMLSLMPVMSTTFNPDASLSGAQPGT